MEYRALRAVLHFAEGLIAKLLAGLENTSRTLLVLGLPADAKTHVK